MKYGHVFLWLPVAVLAAGAVAQEAPERVELKRADLTGVNGIEVVLARTTVLPGQRVPVHTHDGDEHMVVLTGGPVALPDGKEVPLKDGMAIHYPMGKVHGGVTNAGDAPIVFLNVYVIEKGTPLSSPTE